MSPSSEEFVGSEGVIQGAAHMHHKKKLLGAGRPACGLQHLYVCPRLHAEAFCATEHR